MYIEGGGNSKEGKSRCREGFRKLLEKSGFSGRMPRLVASGGRNSAYDNFKTAHAHSSSQEFVALLIDSEEPVENIDETWQHLWEGDCWKKPHNANNFQVFLMTTCMETWIVADSEALRLHFGHQFQSSALLPHKDLESRSRQEALNSLKRATRRCNSSYEKGIRSFELISKVNPNVLQEHLPSFCRMLRILRDSSP